MSRPPQEAFILGAAIAVSPWLVSFAYGIGGNPVLRRRWAYAGWAALALVMMFLALDSWIGFGRMSAFYLGIVGAVLLGAVVGWAANRTN